MRAALPGISGTSAIVHASPALGASFTQYTAEMLAGGRLGATDAQRFVFVLEGAVMVNGTEINSGGYAYLPQAEAAPVTASKECRVAVIEKTYQPLSGTDSPQFFCGREKRG